MKSPCYCKELESRNLDHQRTLAPWKINRQEPSQRPPSQHEGQATPKRQQAPELDAPHQSFSKTGAQPCYMADRLPKTTKPIDTLKDTTGHSTALQRNKTQPHLPEYRHKSSQPGNHHKALAQSHPGGQTP